MSRSLTEAPEPEENEAPPITMVDVLNVLMGLTFEVEELAKKVDTLIKQQDDL